MSHDYTQRPAINEGRQSQSYGHTRLSYEEPELSIRAVWIVLALALGAAAGAIYGLVL